jgi:hypothetical protein
MDHMSRSSVRMCVGPDPGTLPEMESASPGREHEAAENDVSGFMMPPSPKNPPIAGDGVGGGGAPIGLFFEWIANPAGTFGKYYFGSY